MFPLLVNRHPDSGTDMLNDMYSLKTKPKRSSSTTITWWPGIATTPSSVWLLVVSSLVSVLARALLADLQALVLSTTRLANWKPLLLNSR